LHRGVRFSLAVPAAPATVPTLFVLRQLVGDHQCSTSAGSITRSDGLRSACPTSVGAIV